jgi:hypothetical protein
MVDWYPTFLGLAGASAAQPLPLDGLDAWPTIAQGKPSPHDTILINSVGREGAVRCGDWKLVRNGKSGDEEKEQADEEKKAAPRIVRIGKMPLTRMSCSIWPAMCRKPTISPPPSLTRSLS